MPSALYASNSAGPGHQQKVRVAPRSSGAQQCSERLIVECSVCQPGATQGLLFAMFRVETYLSLLGVQHPELLLATPRCILWVGEIISAPLGQRPSLLTAGLDGGSKMALGKKGNMMRSCCSHCQVIAVPPPEMWSLTPPRSWKRPESSQAGR